MSSSLQKTFDCFVSLPSVIIILYLLNVNMCNDKQRKMKELLNKWGNNGENPLYDQYMYLPVLCSLITEDLSICYTVYRSPPKYCHISHALGAP